MEPTDGEALERDLDARAEQAGEEELRQEGRDVQLPFRGTGTERLLQAMTNPTSSGTFSIPGSSAVSYGAPIEDITAATDPDRAFETIEDHQEWVALPLDDLVDLCYSYLSTLHTTLWADWDISKDEKDSTNSAGKPRGRIVAARWLAEQIKGVAAMAEEENDGNK